MDRSDAQLPIPYALAAPGRRGGAVLAAQARQLLREASAWVDADERFRLAHLAALRSSAALFAERARPGSRRGPTSAWVLLAEVAPEMTDWATYFSAGAAKRAAIEFGSHGVVSAREADDLVRGSSDFLHLVEVSLGLADGGLAGSGVRAG